ncbi:MAG TPA: hypothetical protein PLN91_00825 [Rhodanobacteraceae bacterium]|nr:hypothetical protein [Rhodanobacteraceae bacterium]
MKQHVEAELKDAEDAFATIFAIHGPRRYREYPDGAINGACACMQPQSNFGIQPGQELKVDGPGAIWAWFVGSPRVFQFGFVRSRSWATRRMHETLLAEAALHQQVK